MGDAAAERTVLIVAHQHDSIRYAEVASAAERNGWRVLPDAADSARATLCVVLLSEAAAADPAFMAHAEMRADAALSAVPVQLDSITPERCGPAGSPLRERQWIWARELPEAWDRLFRAHVWLYQEFEDLRTRAERWDLVGRDNSFLIQNKEDAERASDVIQEMANDTFYTVDKTLAAYVHASLLLSARVRRHNMQRAMFTAFFVIVAIGVVLLVRWAVSEQVRESLALARSSFSSSYENDPAFTAVETASMMSEDLVSDWLVTTEVGLYSSLWSHWPAGTLGTVDLQRDGTWQGDGVFTDNGTYWVRTRGGVLEAWDMQSLCGATSAQASQDDQFVFDATPDGSRAVVADTEGVHLLDLASGARKVLVEDALDVVDVAISGDGDGVVIARANAVESIVSARTGSRMDGLDEVLACARTALGPCALVRKGASIELVRGPELAIVFEVAVPEAQVYTGALAPDGSAVICADGALLEIGLDGAAPAPRRIGATVRDLPDAMAATNDVVIIATAADGVQVFDRVTGALLGEIAQTMAGVCFISVSSDGIACCSNGFYTAVDDLADLIPCAAEPAYARLSTGLFDSVRWMSVEAEGSRITMSNDSGSDGVVLKERMGEVAAVSLASDGLSFAAGTSSGSVVCYSLSPKMRFQQTQAWQVPTGDPVEAIGWSEDAQRLVVKAAGRWWTPWSNHTARDNEGIAELIRARQPIVWRQTEIDVLPQDYVQELGMRAAPAFGERGRG